MKYSALFVWLTAFTTVYAQTEVTDSNAQSKLLVNNDKLIVVDFYATWCGPCKTMDPILKELSDEYMGSVDFYKIDVDANQIDDALGVDAMPTYYFIKNSSTLEIAKGSMSKNDMEKLIQKYVADDGEEELGGVEEVVLERTETSDEDTSSYDALGYHNTSDELERAYKIWNNSSQLNTLAWHIYLVHEDRMELYKAIDIVKRSIELQRNYYNLDTHAALLFKIQNYTKALKKAKEAIEQAKLDGENYKATTELMNKIIDKM